jgi:methylated-DNA-[protein]-cysteine S-methyltransferase
MPDFFMEKTFKRYIDSPVGVLEITTSPEALLSVSFVTERGIDSDVVPGIMKQTIIQLEEYFTGKRSIFNLKLEPSGSDFQQRVWKLVAEVGFGRTSSYLDIALRLGSEKNTRAVGLANGKNPIPIIIPCHRIIGSNGKLTGYAGGLERKRWLLLHESQYSPKNTLF